MENNDKKAWMMLGKMFLNSIVIISLLVLIGFLTYFFWFPFVNYLMFLTEKLDSILLFLIFVPFLIYGLFKWKEHLKYEILESEKNSHF